MGDFLFRRPLIKLSGEALGGAAQSGIDLGFIEGLAAEIAELSRAGVAPAIVVGGGNLFRGVSGASRGLDRVRADQMGMLATVMNALALQDCFLANGVPASVYSGLPVPSICDAFRADRARAERDAGSIVILAGGTGNPFFTTDTTAALRAAELRCDAILKATQVDGIYSSDPKLDANATRYDRLTFSEVLSHNLKVMDAAAIAIARDNKIPIVVFSLGEQRAILNVLTGRALFTMVSGI